MSKENMAKNTDKQAIENMSDNFRGYATLLRKIKQRVLIAQQRAIYAANEEMLRMYWDIGGMLQQSQDADGWGKKTLQRLAVDLKNDYSEIKGFSVRNMQCMIQFFNEYNQELTMVKGEDFPITQPVVAQLGQYNFALPIKHLSWAHNLILLQQVKDIRARYWYMVQSITSHWSKRYLQEAIKLDDYGKHGALANNFTETLPVPEANDVKAMLKDPYIFDMLRYSNPVDIHEPVHYSVDGEGGYSLYTEFLLNILPVADDGGESDVQSVGNFLVHQSLGYQRQNLYLAAAEDIGLCVMWHLR